MPNDHLTHGYTRRQSDDPVLHLTLAELCEDDRIVVDDDVLSPPILFVSTTGGPKAAIYLKTETEPCQPFLVDIDAVLPVCRS